MAVKFKDALCQSEKIQNGLKKAKRPCSCFLLTLELEGM